MFISSVSYVKGVLGTDDILYDGKSQIAFMGRSNVGKSSTINSLLGQDIARSSKYPGRTKRLDFFLVNKSFYFVDLPGYGFANLPGEKREQIRKMILWYFEFSEVKNRMVVLIVDAQIGMTKFDSESVTLLSEQHIPFIVVANKMDKVKMSEKKKQIDSITKGAKGSPVFPYSCQKTKGKQEILNKLGEFLQQA